MRHRGVVVAGGVSFVIGAIAFVLVFGYLAVNFDYPGILEGSATEVLPRLRQGGAGLRAVWAVYAFLPLFLLPGAVGAYFSCPASPGRMSLALILACVAAVSMSLGLLRWPSVHWVLAEAYGDAGMETQHSIVAVFDGLNRYLGNYIGEFLGETTLASFFLLTARSFGDEPRFPKWLGWTGGVFAVLMLIGALRNVTHSVQVVADINNAFLPLWMLVLGAALIRYSGSVTTPAQVRAASAGTGGD